MDTKLTILLLVIITLLISAFLLWFGKITFENLLALNSVIGTVYYTVLSKIPKRY
jgi:hypothetical protein